MDTARETGLYSTAARWANCGDTHVNLLLTKKEEQVMVVKTSVILGCPYLKVVGSHLAGRVRKENRRVQMPDLGGADFGLM